MDLINNKGKMSSLRIAELTRKRHDHVVRDIRKLNDTYKEIGEPKIGETSYTDKSNRQSICFELNESQSMDLAMGYSQQLRILVRKDWEKMKRVNHLLPKTFADALLLAAEQAKKIEVLQDKEVVADRLLESTISISIGDFSKCYCDKLHNIGSNRLFDLLRSRSHLIDKKGYKQHNTPYQRYIDAGYYELKERIFKNKGKDDYYLQTFITPKGQQWLLKNLDKLLG